MENKNIIIIAVVVIVIVAIAGYIFATGMLNNEDNKNIETTPFKTAFMEGSFVGKVNLTDGKEKYMHSYQDKKHHITYNVSTVDNSSALMDIYYLQGVMNPEHRTINNIKWNIYFTQAVPENGSSNETMNIIICQSQGEKQGYIIYAIFDAKSDVNSTLNTFGESYTDYIEPLLESITLKKSSDVPKIYDEFGLSKSEFAQQMDLIQEFKAGNTSALEGT